MTRLPVVAVALPVVVVVFPVAAEFVVVVVGLVASACVSSMSMQSN